MGVTVADESCVTAAAVAADMPSAPGRESNSDAAARRAVVVADAGVDSNATRRSVFSCAVRITLISLPMLPANASSIDCIWLSKRRSRSAAAAAGVMGKLASSSSLAAMPSCLIFCSALLVAVAAAVAAAENSASAAAHATDSTAAALGLRERVDARLAALAAGSRKGTSVCDAEMLAPAGVCIDIDDDDEDDDDVIIKTRTVMVQSSSVSALRVVVKRSMAAERSTRRTKVRRLLNQRDRKEAAQHYC